MNLDYVVQLSFHTQTVGIAVRAKKAGAEVHLKEKEILGLCHASREILQSQPMLLELEAPVRICGESGN
jgi:serine/threonine-protein phosphatase PP1 catalytic subunit